METALNSDPCRSKSDPSFVIRPGATRIRVGDKSPYLNLLYKLTIYFLELPFLIFLIILIVSNCDHLTKLDGLIKDATSIAF